MSADGGVAEGDAAPSAVGREPTAKADEVAAAVRALASIASLEGFGALVEASESAGDDEATRGSGELRAASAASRPEAGDEGKALRESDSRWRAVRGGVADEGVGEGRGSGGGRIWSGESQSRAGKRGQRVYGWKATTPRAADDEHGKGRGGALPAEGKPTV